MALEEKRMRKLSEWVNKNISNAYVMVIDDYQSCGFEYDWFPEDRP
jgi:hypothetical protein